MKDIQAQKAAVESRVSNKMKDETKHSAEDNMSEANSEKQNIDQPLSKRGGSQVQEKYLGEIEKQKYEQYKIAK